MLFILLDMICGLEFWVLILFIVFVWLVSVKMLVCVCMFYIWNDVLVMVKG